IGFLSCGEGQFDLIDPAYRINIVQILNTATNLLIGQGQVFLGAIKAIGADNTRADLSELLVQPVDGALQTVDELWPGGCQGGTIRFQIVNECIQVGKEAATVEINAFDGFVASQHDTLGDRYLTAHIITLVSQACAGIGNRRRIKLATAEQVVAVFVPGIGEGNQRVE